MRRSAARDDAKLHDTRAHDTRAFEDSLRAEPAAQYHLRLFVAGSTPRSARAIQNIRAICEDNLRGRYDLEVIDIYQHPEQIKPEQIVVIPTLVKEQPLPLRKMIGDLSNKEQVLIGLDIVRHRLPARLQENEHVT
jgi:circadian clock protein KaiB